MLNEWWLARNKDWHEDTVQAYPTQLTGVIKREGCMQYLRSPLIESVGFKGNLPQKLTGGLMVYPKDCKKIFGHCPKKGELLCVTKTRKGWKSENIELEFS